LASSVWTKDISKAHKLAGMIRSGAVWMKCHNLFDASLPFGGYKQSGWGREIGGEARNYTDSTAVTQKF
jgi:phenylacetaldehyde dehydrogenase